MGTVRFWRNNEAIILKDNSTWLRPTPILTAIVSLVFIIVFYLDIVKKPIPKIIGPVIFAAIFLTIFIVAFAYNVYKIFSRRKVELMRRAGGYLVKENGKVQTSLIKEILKVNVAGKYEKGYLIAVKDIENKMFTLFEELPETDALQLTAFLSAEMTLSTQAPAGNAPTTSSTETILFSKNGDTLVLKYNPKRVKRNVMFVSLFFGGLGTGLYLLVFGAKADFTLIAVMLGMYLISIAYYLYSVYSKWHLQLIKKGDAGYLVKKNNEIKTGIIKTIIKTHDVEKYNHGYSITVTDVNNEEYELFNELPEAEALNLTLTLSTEMNVPIERIEPRF